MTVINNRPMIRAGRAEYEAQETRAETGTVTADEWLGAVYRAMRLRDPLMWGLAALAAWGLVG